MSEENYAGGCFCGAVQFRASGPVRNLCLCHCESCRRAAGAPFVAWGTVHEKNFELVQGNLAIYGSSEGVERGFCKQCGTTLTYANSQRKHDVDFTLASLVDPDALAPEMQIFVEDRLTWINTNPDLPEHQTVPGADS